MPEDRCICCGEIIPEGRQVCPKCVAKVKEPNALRIAFLGYNRQQTQEAFQDFAKNNCEQIRKYYPAHGLIVLNDGTTIHSIDTTPGWLHVRHFDQIIIADELGKSAISCVMIKHFAFLEELERRCDRSIVPPDFRYLYYYTG